MTYEEFKDTMQDESVPFFWNIHGDKALIGLNLIAKYFDSDKEIITGIKQGIIYSVNIMDLVEKNITQEDVKQLKELGWLLSDDETYLMKYM